MSEHKTLIINPLVLFSIADHYKRKRAELGFSSSFKVVGALYGTQDHASIKANIACPLKLNETESSPMIDKQLLQYTLDQTTELIQTDHKGNHLANLQLIGFYKGSTKVDHNNDDKTLFECFSSRLENARELIMNPEETDQTKSLRVYMKGSSTEIVSSPYDLAVEKSETICMQSITTSGKEAPYLKSLISLKSVTTNYNDLLKQLKTLMPLISDDIFKLRELNSILNSLNYVSEDKKIIKNLDGCVIESLAACMYLDETKRINKSFDY